MYSFIYFLLVIFCVLVNKLISILNCDSILSFQWMDPQTDIEQSGIKRKLEDGDLDDVVVKIEVEDDSDSGTCGEPQPKISKLESINELPLDEKGNCTLNIIIPAGKAGMIIGTAGSTVKQMMAESGARMNLIQDCTANTGIDKPLKIYGTPQQVKKAQEMVMHMICEDGGAPPYIEIQIPKFAVGMIIGNKGATINKLQDEYEVRIQVKPDTDAAGSTRVCQILGEPEKYQNAARKVLELIACVEARDKMKGLSHHRGRIVTPSAMELGPSAVSVNCEVPADKVGLVIGKNGDTVRKLQGQTMCKIELNTEVKASKPNHSVFTIRGNKDNVENTCHLVKQAADGIYDAINSNHNKRNNQRKNNKRDRYRVSDSNKRNESSRSSSNSSFQSSANWNQPPPNMSSMMPPANFPPMPPMMPPMMPFGQPPQMPSWPSSPSFPFWPGFMQQPSPSMNNSYDMFTQWMKMYNQWSSNSSPMQSMESNRSSSSDDSWNECYKRFMDVMKERPSESRRSSSDSPKEWMDYFSKMSNFSGSNNTDAWKKWFQQYQNYYQRATSSSSSRK